MKTIEQLWFFVAIIATFASQASAQCLTELQAVKDARMRGLRAEGLLDGKEAAYFTSAANEFVNGLREGQDKFFGKWIQTNRETCRADVSECGRYLNSVRNNHLGLIEEQNRAMANPYARPEEVAVAAYRACRHRLILQEIQAMMKDAALGSSGINSSAQGEKGSADQSSGENQKEGAQQSLALAQQNQSQGDAQAKKDGRRRSNPEYEANNCLSLANVNDPRSFGALQNDCSYKVNFNFCVFRPKPSSWATAFDCEKQSFGGVSAGANGGKGFSHMKGGEAVHFFACREPALVLDTRFIAAVGRVEGRCRKIGS